MEAARDGEGVVEARDHYKGGHEVREVVNQTGCAVIRIGSGEDDKEDQGDFKEGGGFPQKTGRERAIAPSFGLRG